MQVAFCKNCNKHTGHKRAIGAGTVLGAVVTGGVSLLAIPAYSKRCVICGLTEGQAASITSGRPAPSDTGLVLVTVGIVLLIVLFFVIANAIANVIG